MKKQPIKYYFINCKLKFTRSERIVENYIPSFKYSGVEIEDCLIITTEGKKSIEYITFVGAVLKHNILRVKKKKFDGFEVSKEIFFEKLRQCKFEVFTNISEIKDEKIKVLREKEFFEFPIK